MAQLLHTLSLDSQDLSPYRTLYDGDRFHVYGVTTDLQHMLRQFLEQHSERDDTPDTGSRALLDVLLKYLGNCCQVDLHEDAKDALDDSLALKDDEGADDARQLAQRVSQIVNEAVITNAANSFLGTGSVPKIPEEEVAQTDCELETDKPSEVRMSQQGDIQASSIDSSEDASSQILDAPSLKTVLESLNSGKQDADLSQSQRTGGSAGISTKSSLAQEAQQAIQNVVLEGLEKKEVKHRMYKEAVKVERDILEQELYDSRQQCMDLEAKCDQECKLRATLQSECQRLQQLLMESSEEGLGMHRQVVELRQVVSDELQHRRAHDEQWPVQEWDMLELVAALREENHQLMVELVERKLQLAQLSEQHTKSQRELNRWKETIYRLQRQLAKQEAGGQLQAIAPPPHPLMRMSSWAPHGVVHWVRGSVRAH